MPWKKCPDAACDARLYGPTEKIAKEAVESHFAENHLEEVEVE